MIPDGGLPEPAAPWHMLLGPLPDGAMPRRKPVASAEILATPAGRSIAGWDDVVLELSAGAAGSRVLHVLLDQSGQPLSASDHVLYWSEGAGVGQADPDTTPQIYQESIGGRFESDGTFSGTRWLIMGSEPASDADPQWDMTHREPTVSEVEALRSLVAELLRRQPPR